jgi:hypothetical protein
MSTTFPSLTQTFEPVVLKELAVALAEIGPITPTLDPEYGNWVFRHTLYPSVEYWGETAEEVQQGYPFYLAEFIKHRLASRIHEQDEQATQGRGGRRPGAGRPMGAKGAYKTQQVRIIEPLALQLKSNQALQIKLLNWLDSQSTV